MPHSSEQIPTIQLHNGVEMPQMSLGLAFWNVKERGVQHNPRFTGFLPEQCYRSLHMALHAGIRGIDTALIYRTHSQIRHVLGDWLASGKVKREDLFVATKVFHPMIPFALTSSAMPENLDHLTPEEVTRIVTLHVERSLDELGLGYLDLVLLHWPAGHDSTDPGNSDRRVAAWKVLEGFYEKGWIRAIGVSNFSEHHLKNLIHNDTTKIVPMVNQIESSVYLQWDKIVEYCHANNIVVEAFSPLGHGASNVISDEYVLEIAKKHDKDAGQIAMRYLVQKGFAVTFSTGSEKRLSTNQDIFQFELDEEDMDALDALNGTAETTGQPSPYDMS
jgi:diketogulonate reductase-like aldo/keto reductase